LITNQGRQLPSHLRKENTMKKIYIMIIENPKTGERKVYKNSKQGSAPADWKCVGVSGYFERS
jgi:hypothetical protein